jgi:hypothetical protein
MDIDTWYTFLWSLVIAYCIVFFRSVASITGDIIMPYKKSFDG